MINVMMDRDNQILTHQTAQMMFEDPAHNQSSQSNLSHQEPAEPTNVRSMQSQRKSSVRKPNPPSCHACRRRKIKCDRADPCSHCVRSGQACISSASSSAPRGRQGGRRRKLDGELMERIAKLENLVKDMEGETTESKPSKASLTGNNRTASEESETQPSRDLSGKSERQNGLNRYLGGSLWMSLSDEINGMRDVLDQSSDEDDEGYASTPKPSTPGQDSTDPSAFVVCAPEFLSSTEGPFQHPGRSQVESLFSSYMANVDPPVKILHGPSLKRYMVEGTESLDCSPGPKGWEALSFAIYYIATTSLTPLDCLQQLGEEKTVLLQRFRSGTELALAKADFVNSEEMSILQALVLYLFAIRSNENSRRSWTMLGLAVRIAHALGLHREKDPGQYVSPYTPFEREMRRRLWWQISLIDRQGSVDRCSDPLIAINSFSTQLPLNVNDEDLDPNETREIQPRSGYTDTTLSIVCHEVFDIERRLNYVPAGEIDSLQLKGEELWAQRREWVIACQQRIERNYLQYCDTSIPVHRYMKIIADIMMAMMWFLIYRPLQRHSDSYTSIQVPPPGVLHLCCEVLERAIQVFMDKSLGNFRWMSRVWVQWHALAVMIAELCVQIEGPTVERAWNMVNTIYDLTARHIADSDKGRLWRPIKKMMRNAQAVRKNYLEQVTGDLNFETSLKGVQPSHTETTPLNHIPHNTMMTETEEEEIAYPQQPQGIVPTHDPAPINWDPWVGTVPSQQMEYNNDLNQMAWTNWEAFIDDYQAGGQFMPGQNAVTPPRFDGWQWQ